MSPTEAPKTHHVTASLRESTRALLRRYRAGHPSALDVVLSREIGELRRWARGRLPRWARAVLDTGDLVQDALARTVPRLSRFEPRHEKALRAYLRNAVQNGIRDELRRQQSVPPLHPVDLHPGLASGLQSPLEAVLQSESDTLFARALETLQEGDRMAIVARLRLGYSYDQISLLLGKRSADAARMAVTRAVERLAQAIAEPMPRKNP